MLIIKYMRKILLILLFLFISFSQARAEVLQAGVSIEQIPKALFGSWRVSAKLDTTNSPSRFKPQSIDFWNMSRINDKITLDNPFSGANAEITVKAVEGNLVIFTKTAKYDENKVLTDTVTLRLNKNKFSGINTLKLESFSLVDNHLIKTETATYLVTGEKISGDSVIDVEESVENSVSQ